MNKWISVKEELPKNKGQVLVVYNNNRVYPCGYYDNNWVFRDDGLFYNDHKVPNSYNVIQYWMYISTVVELNEWIDIKKMLPNLYKKILLKNKLEGIFCGYYDGVNFINDIGRVEKDVVCWMYFPEPPKGEKKNE